MFSFKANIIKRKRIKKRSLLTGLLSAALLGYMGLTYLDMSRVPILDNLIAQIGLGAYSPFVYLGLLALLLFLIMPAFRTLFKKKTIINGAIQFDEETLQIVKGKEKFNIPQEQLEEISFDIKALPEGKEKKKDPFFGGSFMRIPTKKGVFECELDIDSKEQHLELLDMAEFLKIKHDVKVKITKV